METMTTSIATTQIETIGGIPARPRTATTCPLADPSFALDRTGHRYAVLAAAALFAIPTALVIRPREVAV